MIENSELVHQTWPEWKVQKKLGEGSYGSVYLAEREDMLGKVQAAIKVVSIPQDNSTVDALRAERMDDASIHTYLETQVKELGAEIRLMETVKGYTNIVSIEDYRLISQPEIPQWHVLIRMELLKPLLTHMADQQLSVKDVVNLGCDICSALVVCRQKNIVHRDIKPENIFINQNGDYKLGDFGVARTLEGKTNRMTRIGTGNYMAPEIFNNVGGKMDINDAARADIYSLGIVMYTILNNGRIPFLPTGSTFSQNDRDKALLERMHGSVLPPPLNGTDDINRIIFKAAAFKPADRYASAEEMRTDLLNLRSGSSVLPPPPAPSKRPVAIIAVGIGAALAIGAGAWFMTQRPVPDDRIVPVVSTAPAAVRPEITVEGPSEGAYTVKWQGQEAVTQYALELNLPNGRQERPGTTEALEWVIPLSELEEGQCAVRVGAIPDGQSVEKALWSSRADIVVEIPSLQPPEVTIEGAQTGPAGLPLCTEGTVTVKWAPLNGATEYAARLVLPDGTTQEGPISSWNTRWTIALDALPEGLCAAEVVAIDANGAESEPGRGEFEIVRRPEAPVLTLKDAEDGPDGLPRLAAGADAALSWEAQEGVSSWTLHLEGPDGAAPGAYDPVQTPQWQISAGDLIEAGVYTAEVRSVGSYGDVLSQPGSLRFEVMPAEAAVLEAPGLNVEQRESSVSVTWDALDGAEFYQLALIAPDGTRRDNGSVVEPIWEISVQDLDEGTYTAEVVAIGADDLKSDPGTAPIEVVREAEGGESTESPSPEPSPEPISAPTVAVELTPAEARLEWEAQPGAAQYALRLVMPDGSERDFGTTPDNAWVLPLEELEDGAYTASIGAISSEGDVSDALWGDASFVVARPKELVLRGDTPVEGEENAFTGGTIEISWERQEGVEMYLFALNRPDGTRSDEGSTHWNNKWRIPADGLSQGSYQALVGAVPAGGEESEARWLSVDFRILPGPVLPVDAPVVTVLEADNQENGVDWLTGDAARLSWQTQENAARYAVELTSPNGGTERIENAQSDGVEIDLTDRPAGIYTVAVCAIPVNGEESDGARTEVRFGIPERPVLAWEQLADVPELQSALADYLGVEVGAKVDEALLSQARYCSITPSGIAFYGSAAQWKRALEGQERELLLSERPIEPIVSALNTPGLAVEGLALADTLLNDIAPLSGLPGLRALWLENTGLENLSPLAALTGLERLELPDNQISDIGPLKGLTGLKQLNLSRNRVTDVAPLAPLTGLTSLDLDGNGLKSVAPLAGLHQLVFLDLSDNEITNVTPLSSLTAMRQLMLQNNSIQGIGVLANMDRLTLLMLQNNQIRDIEPLSGLTNLRFLWLSNNGIQDLSPLSGLQDLDTLYIDCNQIVDVSPIAGLERLNHVCLYGNAIENVSPLSRIQTLYK